MIDFRCSNCNKLLAKVESIAKIEIVCPRCKHANLTNDGINHNNTYEEFMNEKYPDDHSLMKLFK